MNLPGLVGYIIIVGLSMILLLIVSYLAVEFVHHYLHYREAGDSRSEAARWAWLVVRPWI